MSGRGLFAVDLASRSGSRVGPEQRLSGWLRPGDSLWVADRRIAVTLVDVDQPDPNSSVDPISDVANRPLTQVTLFPEGHGTPLVLHSELVFLGRSPACGVNVADPMAAPVHCVLVRDAEAAYVVDLVGRHVGLNGRSVRGCAELLDKNILTVGSARLECRVSPANEIRLARVASPSPTLAVVEPEDVDPLIPYPPQHLLAPGAQGELVAWLMGMLQATHGELLRRQNEFQRDVQQTLRRMQNEQVSGFREQLDRVEDLHHEVAGLREEIRRCYGHEPVRRGELPRPAQRSNSSPPAPPDDGATAAWLMKRIQQINHENGAARREARGRRGK